MFRKMIASFIIMTIFATATLFYLIASADGDNRTDMTDVDFSFEDEGYYFYMTDGEIASAIQEARESIRLTDPFQLTTNNTETVLEEISFVYVEPPELTVKLEARRILDHFGRTPSVPEIKDELSDRYLPVNARFYDHYAYVFDVTVSQGIGDEAEEVDTYEANKSSGSLKSVLMDMGQVDTNRPLHIRFEDTSDPSVYVTYSLDFDDYRQ
ncbi:hypothetical protein [Salisediminibacterium beveridgei]|uniref:Uncharacterized protein n=1 Tax=Salisediminibacterium beveridgei TaxID=632773 RepID=A0A1D7QSU6_9BACI|nr:hypothetical protein [Salisediminibacterium beveridgei]AOM82084.1 hypothetical protein BBEV_0712 [Salisediminibacterium beveridgei]